MRFKFLMVAAMVLCMATAAMADNCTNTMQTACNGAEFVGPPAPPGVSEATGSRGDIFTTGNVVAVLVSPVVVPANLLSVPYYGAIEALKGIDKIPCKAGRVASMVALAPLMVPSAILNFPSVLLSATGLTTSL
ncbi:MAG: hypothetical protein M0Z78_08880 [Betaproteobacteria bacterium]|nr:hypothetical protein [Betaproteobacteria bacterium]